MAFATLTELEARLEWDLDAGEKRIAQSALDDLSEDAKFHGNPRWDDTNVPPYVKTLVLKAAQRYMRNPDGYESSRAGDEALGWGERPGDESGSAEFTDKEITMLRSLVRKPALGSVNVQAYGTALTPNAIGYVPVAGGGDPFPMYAQGTEPW